MHKHLSDWLRLLQTTTHFCPRCGGLLQLELTRSDHRAEGRAGLAVWCSQCPAHLILTADEVEAAVTEQLLVYLGLRPQRVWRGGGWEESREVFAA